MEASYQVLIADDDAEVLRFAVRVLEQNNYECKTAKDAYEAAHILKTEQFDLLVSDLEMPGNEGLRLIRDVPQISAGLPVIMITGYPSVETAVQSLQLPVAAYLTKPFKMEDLLREAEQAIKNFQAFRAVCACQERTERWNEDLTTIKARIVNIRSAEAAPWATMMDLTLRNIAESLQDVRTFAEVATQHISSKEHAPPRASAGPLILVNALRETISVLEKTRSSFKSKELGDLRRRLELLLNGDGSQI
jgi:DNA-binding response OmpR family regulator